MEDTSAFGPGDRALGALLLAHGLVMNGGVLHAIEALQADERAAAAEGYAYFGFDDIAALLREEIESPDDDDEAEAQEFALNERYAKSIPSDGVLTRAFEASYTSSADAYAPPPPEDYDPFGHITRRLLAK